MEIYINGIVWGVEFVPGYSELLVMPDGISTLGVTDNSVKTIYLFNALRGSLLRKVLIHEITHAWAFSYNYQMSVEQEEFVCDFVASNADDIIAKADELIHMGLCRYSENYF